MFYERKIKYLDYMVSGVRNGNAGFWKLEARDTVCNMTIQVKGLRNSDSLRCPVYLAGNGLEKEIGALDLVQGRGSICLRGENLSNLGGIGIPYEMLEGLRIPISAEREVRGVLCEDNDTLYEKKSVPNEKTSEAEVVDESKLPCNELDIETQMEAETEGAETNTEEVSPEAERSAKDEFGKELQLEAEINIVPKLSVEQEAWEVNNLSTELEQKEMQGGMLNEMSDPDRGNDFLKRIMEKPKSVLADSGLHRIRLCNSKWEQLWEIYPRMAPFRDEREYISIGPSDFVVLPAKYFRLANNSFLLHGYYNYKHLVLKRVESRNEDKYYIGVPGTFFDREKQVAVMFGFESFECMEEPAQTGDYGYYMMRIEL